MVFKIVTDFLRFFLSFLLFKHLNLFSFLISSSSFTCARLQRKSLPNLTFAGERERERERERDQMVAMIHDSSNYFFSFFLFRDEMLDLKEKDEEVKSSTPKMNSSFFFLSFVLSLFLSLFLGKSNRTIGLFVVEE